MNVVSFAFHLELHIVFALVIFVELNIGHVHNGRAFLKNFHFINLDDFHLGEFVSSLFYGQAGGSFS